ncbi:hypothetical protein [Actinoallomurus sp. CA-150999]|uniref:hypothetical protein n=1 Tax=Actinoallomurus sp. CA-150999 TaxID=3239887 RepID=UPI003D8C7FDD
MELLNGVRLVPVVEAYTGVLGDEDFGPITEPRWDAYSRFKIVEAGLPAPVAAHPWLVRAVDLRGPGLTRLVRASLFATGDEDGELLLARIRDPATREQAVDEVVALPGGLMLETPDGRCLALPGCCGDIGNLRDWREATLHDDPVPAGLWIGHPMLTVSGDGPVLTLAGPVDLATEPAPVIARTGRQALAEAVTTAEAEVARFAGELRSVCGDMVGAEAAPPMAGALIG